MHKTEVIHTRLTPVLKRSAEAVFARLGLSTTDAVSLFLHQVVLNKGLPFDVRIPNKETRRVLEEARSGRNMKTYESVDELRQAVEGKAARSRKK